MSSNLTLRAHIFSVYQKAGKRLNMLTAIPPSLSNTVEQIRPVNGLTQPVAQFVVRRAVTREVVSRKFDSGRTITQGLKITEEKVLPLQLHQKMVRLSSLLG